MNVFQRLQEWAKPNQRVFKVSVNPKELEPGDMAQFAMKKGCPVCLVHPMKLIMGPGSGNGENVFCKGCGSRFTMYPLPGHPMMSLVTERELSAEELAKHE